MESVPKNSAERKYQKNITLRKKPRMEGIELEEREEGFRPTTPVWWEVAMFRILNAIMVIFFLTATVKLQSDDNACLWIPAFLVPAFLSSVVAMKPQLSGRRFCSHLVIMLSTQSVCGGRPGWSSTPPSPSCWPLSGPSSWSGPSMQRGTLSTWRLGRRGRILSLSILFSMRRAGRAWCRALIILAFLPAYRWLKS